MTVEPDIKPAQVQPEIRPVHFVPKGTPVAFVDIDGTIYPGLMMEGLVREQIGNNLLRAAQIPQVLAAIDDYKRGDRGKASNVQALNNSWALACQGLPYAVLADHARQFVTTNRDKFHSFTGPVFDLLKRKGYDVYLITGEPQFVARPVVEQFGARGASPSKWEVDEELTVTGNVVRFMTSQEKKESAEFFFNPKSQYTRKGSVAFIDSEGDFGLASSALFSVVAEDSNTTLIDHLARSGKTYVVASPSNVVRFVDILTSNLQIAKKGQSVTRESVICLGTNYSTVQSF